MPAVQKALKLVPDLAVETVASSCCGMAGAFGYEAAHYEVSMKMAEAALLPAVRKADADTLVVADGTSCRHQIGDGRTAALVRHVHHVDLRKQFEQFAGKMRRAADAARVRHEGDS